MATSTANHGARTAASASASAVWPLKEIIYPPHSDRRIKIVYQRRNGPCSLLAICNILILRGDVEIQPPGRKTASYEYLSSLVADFLVTKHGGSAAGNEGDLTSALAVLPSTQEGMDLNPLFTGMSSFRPEGSGGELQLFELCNILLVHGWLVDPQSPEYDIVAKAQDYDTALNMIVAGEEASEAQISTKAPDDAIGSSPPAPDEDTHLRDGLVLRQFLEQNPTQLTFHGLWSLFSLNDGLYAFIRNSHLSVLYKCQSPTPSRTSNPETEEGIVGAEAGSGDPQLWMLVTDSNLVPEPSIVWESIEDVDGADSRFVDSHFFPSSTIGGDYSGYIPADIRPPPPTAEYENDLLLAQQLQAQENDLADQLRQAQLHDREHRRDPSSNSSHPVRDENHNAQSRPRISTATSPGSLQPPTSSEVGGRHSKPSPTSSAGKKKKDCIIM